MATLKTTVEFYENKMKQIKPVNWTLTVVSVSAEDLHMLCNAAKQFIALKLAMKHNVK